MHTCTHTPHVYTRAENTHWYSAHYTETKLCYLQLCHTHTSTWKVYKTRQAKDTCKRHTHTHCSNHSLYCFNRCSCTITVCVCACVSLCVCDVELNVSVVPVFFVFLFFYTCMCVWCFHVLYGCVRVCVRVLWNGDNAVLCLRNNTIKACFSL